MRRLTFPVVLVLLLSVTAFAYAGGRNDRNTLQEIAVSEDPAATLIRISGSETPTFNVFRLDDPPRLFIDIAAGDIAAVDGTVEVFNGVIARIGTLSYNKGGAEFARVIVTFETDAPYDVSARGNDILVVVDAEKRKLQEARPEALAKLEEAVQRERALLAQLKSARGKEEQLVSVARQKRAEEEALQARIAAETRKAEEMRRAAEQARLKALEEKELVERSQAKAAEEQAAASELENLEASRIAALREERERLEAANDAAAKAAQAEREKKAAVEKAVELANQARLAVEEERRRAEELKAAALEAALKEKEKVELLRLQTKLQQERKEAIEKELADVARAKEEALAQAISLEQQKQKEVEAALKAKVDALNAKLDAARKAVEKEEQRKEALAEANRQEELRLAATKEAAATEIERRNAEIARQLKDEALAEAKRDAARLEEERKHLEQLVAARRAEQTALATAQEDRAKLEAETRKLEARWQEQASRVDVLKKEREAKFKELAIAEAELVNQKNAVGQLRAQFELEKESLARMVEARKAEEAKLAQLKAETARIEKGKSAAEDARLAKLNKDLESKQARLEKVTGKLAELEREYSRATTQAKANASRVDDLQKELAARNQDVEWLKGRFENLKGNLQQTRAELLQKEAAVAALKKELDSKASSFDKAVANYSAAVAASEAKARLTEQERDELQQLKAELAKAEQDRARLESDRTEMQQRLSRLTAEVTHKEETNKLLSDKLIAAESSVKQLTDHEAQAREALAANRQQRSDVEQEIAELNSSLTRKAEELARLEQAYNKAASRKTADQRASDGQLTQMKEEISVAKASVEQLEARNDELVNKLTSVNADAASLQNAIADLQQRVSREKQARERIAAEKSAMEERLAQTSQTLRTRQQELDDLAARIDATQEAAQAWKAKHETALLQAQKEKSERQKLAARLKELNTELERRDQDLDKYKNLYETKVSETSVVKARKGGLEERLAQKEAALKKANAIAAEAKAESAQWKSRFASLEGELKETRRQQETLLKQLDTAKTKAARVQELEAEIASVRDAAKRAGEYKAELSRTRKELESARKAAVRRNADNQDVQRATELAATVKDLEAKLAQAKNSKTQIAALQKQLKKAEHEAAKVQRLEAKVATLEAHQREAAAEQARLQSELARSQTRKVDNELHQRLVTSLEEKDRELAQLRKEVASSKGSSDSERPAPAKIQKVRARLTSVDFDQRSGTSAVDLRVAGQPRFQVVEKSPTELLLVLQDTSLLPVLERTLDTSEFGGAVRTISSYRSPTSPDTTIIAVQLSRALKGKVVANADGIRWSFEDASVTPRTAVADAGTKATSPRKSRAVAMYPEGVSAGGAQAGGSAGAAPVGAGGSGAGLSVAPASGTPFGIINPRPGKKKKKYTGRRINLSIKDADIQHVLAYLARVGGVNIVTNEGVSGKVSFYLEDVPWDLALDMILRASGLDYVKEQGIYRVAPAEDIQKEYEMALEKKKKLTELKQLQVKLIPVNYADAKELIKQIKPITSAKGSVSMDQRTNTLIVKDIEEHVAAIEDLVKRLDAQTPQVLIEARIVEASKDYGKDLGIQWGGNAQASSATANPTGLIFPSSIGLAGGASDLSAVTLGLFTPSNPNYAVNLPAPAGQGSGGAIGLTLGSLGGAANLSLRLSAAEEEGTVKIVSAPKISTIDNHKATIQQGISFPVSVVSAQGVNTQFFDAQLKMEVTPHVTQDGNIMLKVDLTKNEPDFSQTGANGNPTIRKKEAHTSLLLKDGDTTVIGGIFTRNTASSKKKVPFFADLPLIGTLFSSWSETDSRSELLIFVTPRIVNRQASRVRTEFD